MVHRASGVTGTVASGGGEEAGGIGRVFMVMSACATVDVPPARRQAASGDRGVLTLSTG